MEAIFNNNLGHFNAPVKRHVIDMLVGFAESERPLALLKDRPAYLILEDLWQDRYKAGTYEGLMDLGDSTLFLCGFYPEHLARTRRGAAGLGTYLDIGQNSYDYAVQVGRHLANCDPPISVPFQLADNFKYAARAIFGARARLDPGVVLMGQETIREIFYYMGMGSSFSVEKLSERAALHVAHSSEKPVEKAHKRENPGLRIVSH